MKMPTCYILFKGAGDPGRVLSWLVLSGYAKIAGLIPGQGTYKKQPMNA